MSRADEELPCSIELALPNLELEAGLFGLMYVARESVESSAGCYKPAIRVTNRFAACYVFMYFAPTKLR
jgi:hypothetical protein